MDIDLLKTFIEVSQTQHFGRAADNLFITQSAVSARIRLLENQLSCQLFQRNNKKVSLNHEGQLFLQHAKKILNQWQLAKAELEQGHNANDTFKVASLNLLWPIGLANLAQHTTGSVQLNSFTSELLPQFVERYDGHIISSPHPLLLKHDKMALGELELVAVCSRKFLQAPTKSYIHLPWGNSFERFIEKQGLKPPFCKHVDSLSAALVLLQQQATFIYLPSSFHVQFDDISTLQACKTMALPLSLYSLPTSDSGQRNTVFKAAQQALWLTNNNKR